MRPENANDPMENKILEVAKRYFIAHGYAESSMSDIAEAAGIKRPVLHYYFRTKDRLFNAAFAPIIRSLLPRIPEILADESKTPCEVIDGVVGLYYGLFRENPALPLFVMREMQRDPQYLLGAIGDCGVLTYLARVKQILQDKMQQGVIKEISCRYIFMNFYSLTIMPFVLKNVASTILVEEGEAYDEMLDKWRPYIVSQTWNLVKPD